MVVDVVLSSGFLAFAEQAGFLAGVEAAGLSVDGVCGTSSGALAGALWRSGMQAEAVFDELCRDRPMAWLGLSLQPWRGLFTLDPVRRRLVERLPAEFRGLPGPFAVGVVCGGRAELIAEGTLPDAVAASCAVPWLFQPVDVSGRSAFDGGAMDRTGLAAWRALRGRRPTLLHLVAPSHGPEGCPIVDERVVRSPRSRARLWSLGDARARFEATKRETIRVIDDAARGGWPASV